MIVVTSAAYVDSELQSEFGRLPPAFLPVGNRRLFLRQAELLRSAFPDESLFLSLPESYSVSPRDLAALRSCAIELVRVPDGLGLGDSLLFVINTVGRYDEGLRVLHGDTLISDLPTAWDCIAVSDSADDYDWHVEARPADAAARVWCGYFSFRSIGRLVKCLAAARGAFEKAVAAYDAGCYLQRIHTGQWLDFGHVNTFYRSRGRITTQRAFNGLSIGGCRVRKTGPAEKIRAEAQWFESLPASLRIYVPQLLRHEAVGDDDYGYELEYLCMAPLNELYVHGCNSIGFWARVFRHLARWFGVCRSAVPVDAAACQMVEKDARGILVEKTYERLHTYAGSTGLDLSRGTRLNGRPLPSLLRVFERCAEAADRIPPIPGVLHGDLCFSNIFFDTRADHIKIIDPRGLNFRGEPQLLGDLRYDLAKLAHSVLGLYDHIIADAFDVDDGAGLDFQLHIHADDGIAPVQRFFAGLPLLDGITPRHVTPITVMLFLSMLPLHADAPRRQRGMLANALRMFEDMER